MIVLAVEREGDGATLVSVLPITHSQPRDPNSAVEISLAVKRHLGLDDARARIVMISAFCRRGCSSRSATPSANGEGYDRRR
ncbi:MULTISPECIES: hypothetical protein [Methylosinus]|uniref:hypothetical protein n=1 Tax=Methylosinus TaxID=425 RepID=UPI000688A1F2|nr:MULTISPECIES: hypothetical protein [Methylosinus]